MTNPNPSDIHVSYNICIYEGAAELYQQAHPSDQKYRISASEHITHSHSQ